MTINKIVGISAIILIVAMMGLICCSDKGLFDMQRMKIIKADIDRKNTEIKMENKELYRKINRLKTDMSYIENIARQEMGMVGEADVVLKFKDTPNGS